MSAKTKTLFVLGLLSVSNLAFAENGCPDGMTPFQNGSDPTASATRFKAVKTQRQPNPVVVGKRVGEPSQQMVQVLL